MTNAAAPRRRSVGNIMSNAGGVFVALRMRKERQIVAALRELGALSPAKAAALDLQNGLSGGALRSLVRNGAVVEAGAGAYYLDEAAYDAMRSKRRYRVIIVLFVALAAAFVVAMLNR